MNIRELSKEQLQEESLVDLAYAILEEKKSSIPFDELLKEIQNLLELTEEEIKERLVQFYTDLNVDGRFLLNNENKWGLREWFKIETIEEETAPTIKTRKRKVKSLLSDDEEEIVIDEDDLVFEEDFEEFVDEDEIEDDEDLDDETIDFVDELGDIDVDDPLDGVDDDLIEDDETFLMDEDEELLDDEEKEKEKED